jgi:hypothetical protein
MRFALVPVAALALTGCLGLPAEPLSTSIPERFDNDTIGTERDRSEAPRLQIDRTVPTRQVSEAARPCSKRLR